MKSVNDFGSFQLASIECSHQNIDDIKLFANRNISELCSKKNANLLVFPDEIDYYGDEIGNKTICRITDTTLETGDVLGFVGCNDTSLTIRSRFALEGADANFLHYMLKKVFAINVVDLKHSISKDNALDLFMYLFPYHLKSALQQGLIKKYKTCKYNDANIRGAIDIPRHISHNMPFRGNVAYSTREFSYDNEVTQLIRHTIEFIRKHPNGHGILAVKDVEACVKTIEGATPTYSSSELQSVVYKNLTPIQHPYYTKYRNLQRICLQILQKKGMKYGKGKDKVYGLLFSGSWLWEEYLGLLLSKLYKHYYRNKGQKFSLFDSPYYQRVIPDYIKWDSDGKTALAVADAKYIRLDKSSTYYEEKATAIYYKTITYMHRWNVSTGWLFYPSFDTINSDNMRISNTASFIVKMPLKIPNQELSFDEFCRLMEISEKDFLKRIEITPNK